MRKLFLLLLVALSSLPALGHCDTLDGPVVTAGRRALDQGTVELALVWVQPSADREVRELFSKVIEVRRLDPTAREVSDAHFLETLVRLHRAGEGEAYTGLKPAGRIPPAITALDRALAQGGQEGIPQPLLPEFRGLVELSRYDAQDVEAGRRFVRAYVELVHKLEEPNLHEGAHEGH